MEHNQGFTWSHWTSPSGDYSHSITLACPPWSSRQRHNKHTKKAFSFMVRYCTSWVREARVNKITQKGWTLYSSDCCSVRRITFTEKDAKKVSTYARWYSLLRVNHSPNWQSTGEASVCATSRYVPYDVCIPTHNNNWN
jgi:hypothetical protein